ncbi:MAG: HAMP domain-containing protein [Deltaproteobacteria bacterium]|nr:HAMP domain-containing protein [Deltaproteobacteria bacterium]
MGERAPDVRAAPWALFNWASGIFRVSIVVKIGIKIKLAVILSSLLFVTTFSIGFILVAYQKASLEEQLRSMAGTITHEFANDSKIPFMQRDSLAMNLLVQNILRYPGIHDSYLLNHNFQIEAHKDLQEVGTEFKAFDTRLFSAHNEAAPWLMEEKDGLITFVSPIIFRSTTVGYTVVSFSDSFIQEQVRRSIQRVAVIGFVVVGLVTLLSIPLSSGLLRPVFRLFEGTKEIAMGNFDYRIPEVRKDELGTLVKSFNRMAAELKKKEILKGVFNRYVSPHLADEILKDPEKITLGGDRREVTVMFADIRGFTSIARKLEPEETVDLLNRYFTVITEVIFRFEGTVDKFMGDCVMSVFGAPIKSETHLEQGLKAAMAVKKAVEELNRVRSSEGAIALDMGIGLASGEVIAGNMGSMVRMEYTAVGDTVNLASRLTDLAGGGDILVNEAVYNAVRGKVEAEEIRGVVIKGFDHPVTLYNVREFPGDWAAEVEGIVHLALMELERDGIIL